MSADLSETEKAQIRLFLGWPSRYFQQFDGLERAFSVAATPSPEHDDRLTVIRNALASLADCESKLEAIRGTTYQAAAVDGVVLQSATQRMLIIQDARRHRDRIAATLDVDVINDIWSGAGVTTFASPFGRGPNGNYVRQG